MAKSASAGTHQKFTKTRGKQRNKQRKNEQTKRPDLPINVYFVVVKQLHCQSVNFYYEFRSN